MTKIFTKYEPIPNTRVNDKNYHKTPQNPKAQTPGHLPYYAPWGGDAQRLWDADTDILRRERNHNCFQKTEGIQTDIAV